MVLVASRRNAFSLVELVVVVVILGLIAAIAIPRMSRGAAGATDASVAADLAVLRNAIELYTAEHNGIYPTKAGIVLQLTTYSAIDGTTNADKDADHPFGPYLNAIPSLKVGAEAGENAISDAAATGVAWIYDEDKGTISANTGTATDANGVLYTTY